MDFLPSTEHSLKGLELIHNLSVSPWATWGSQKLANHGQQCRSSFSFKLFLDLKALIPQNCTTAISTCLFSKLYPFTIVGLLRQVHCGCEMAAWCCWAMASPWGPCGRCPFCGDSTQHPGPGGWECWHLSLCKTPSPLSDQRVLHQTHCETNKRH